MLLLSFRNYIVLLIFLFRFAACVFNRCGEGPLLWGIQTVLQARSELDPRTTAETVGMEQDPPEFTNTNEMYNRGSVSAVTEQNV